MNASSNHNPGGDNEPNNVPASSADAEAPRDDSAGQRSNDPRDLDRNGSHSNSATTGSSGEISTGEGSQEGGQEEEIPAELAQALLHIQQSESYSGLLPDGKNWNQYDAHTQERILRMAEAGTTDESKRRDKLIEFQIKEVPKSRWTAAGLFVLAMGCALIAEGAFGSTVLACAFIAGPVIYGAVGFLPSSNRKPKRDEDN